MSASGKWWHNWCFLSSSFSPSLKNTNFGNHPLTRVEICKSSGKIQNTFRAKQSKFGHTEMGKNSFTLPVSLFPKSATVQLQKTFTIQDFSRGGKWYPVSEHPASSLCRMLPKRPTSFSSHPEYWGELHNWGLEGKRKW